MYFFSKMLTIFFVYFVSFSSFASEDVCKTHKLYCAIIELQPKSAPYAMELSNHIYKYSKIYGTDPYISIAIAMQESGLRNIHRSERGVDIEWSCFESCSWSKVERKVYTDFGMFQFHYSALQDYKIDFTRVFDHDLEYIVETHVRILKDKIKMCNSHGDTAWACYHSASDKYRKKYIKMVSRYIEQIKP